MSRQARMHSVAALLGTIGLLWASICPGAADHAPQAPDAIVRTATEQVLDALRSHSEDIANDPSYLPSLMRKTIVPLFDTRSMARAALGRYWREASADQRSRFTEAFERVLIEDYATVFRNYSNQSVEVLRVLPGPNANEAAVPTYVVTPGEQRVRVDYLLRRVGSEWRIDDVTIEGVSLLLTYRNSFFEQLQHETLAQLTANMNRKTDASGRREGE